ncbi:unnamed protein product [Caenorhabditis sp. 36 PRJEB53466]|nr:unnamed protein product [Caenorhabditis sp. 36 PRJEB53466]
MSAEQALMAFMFQYKLEQNAVQANEQAWHQRNAELTRMANESSIKASVFEGQVTTLHQRIFKLEEENALLKQQIQEQLADAEKEKEDFERVINRLTASKELLESVLLGIQRRREEQLRRMEEEEAEEEKRDEVGEAEEEQGVDEEEEAEEELEEVEDEAEAEAEDEDEDEEEELEEEEEVEEEEEEEVEEEEPDDQVAQELREYREAVEAVQQEDLFAAFSRTEEEACRQRRLMANRFIASSSHACKFLPPFFISENRKPPLARTFPFLSEYFGAYPYMTSSRIFDKDVMKESTSSDEDEEDDVEDEEDEYEDEEEDEGTLVNEEGSEKGDEDRDPDGWNPMDKTLDDNLRLF